MASARSWLEQPIKQRPLDMKPIFRLVDDAALRAVENLIGDLHISPHRQAMQKDRVLRGLLYVPRRHHPLGMVRDGIRLEMRAACWSPRFRINRARIFHRRILSM